MVVRIDGKRMFMWRAVDSEGEVLDVLVQKRRNKAAALKLLRKLLKKQGFKPGRIVTDGLASYKAAMRGAGLPGSALPWGDYETTIGRRTRISPSGGGNERCSASSPNVRFSASPQPTVRSTTSSMSSVT